MTTAECIAMVRKFVAYDQDVYQGPEPTDADFVEALNDSLQDIGDDLYIREPAVPLTLTAGVFLYDLSDYSCTTREIVEPLDVVISGVQLMDCAGRYRGPWSEQELEARYPTWRADTPGQPTKWIKYGSSKIILHPAPDDGTAALNTHFVSGQVLPLPLDVNVPAGVPGIPTRLHRALCSHAAAQSAIPNATEASQITRLNALLAYATEQVAQETKRNKSAASPVGSTAGHRRRNHLRL